MSLQGVPAAERTQIAFFGVRNAGKSSLINALTGQDLSIVSDVPGTTTDPVRKTMELLPIGPVVLIDTPGIDDVGVLGEARVRRTRQVLNRTDIAVLVVSAEYGLQEADRELLSLFREKELPFLLIYTKADLVDTEAISLPSDVESNTIRLASAKTGTGIEEIKEALGKLDRKLARSRPLVSDLVQANDLVLLVVPIDQSAPKGRLILPQQMVLRGLLDAGATPMLTRDTEYPETLRRLLQSPELASRLRLVITDSQVFAAIAVATPETIPLTSFSMLMARYKGGLAEAVCGAEKIRELQDGDTILIAEGCTHHRQCEDIGTVKLPHWLESYTGKSLHYAFTSGGDFPEDLSSYQLIIHCGGCMLTEREMRFRTRQAVDQEVPMTNYGVAIAEMHGILTRCAAPLLAEETAHML